MPLTFSENEETQKQQEGLLKALKDSAIAEDYGSSEIKPNSNDLELPNPQIPQSEESSLDEQNHIYVSEEFEEDSVVETTALRHMSDKSKSSPNNSCLTDNYLTVSGTIKRGKKKGQSVEVILNMSREELEILEANITNKRSCNAQNGAGVHIFLWTIFCFPFSIIISGIYSFCLGTITWYNIFKLFSENKSMGYRILFPPLLIVLYPFLIISTSLALGVYAGFKQLSCCWDSWLKEFTDYEKGFYGWFCNSLDISECCPYEVVILSTVQKP